MRTSTEPGLEAREPTPGPSRDESSAPAAPGPPPREVTHRAGFRAWNDPYVRFAWLCGIAILAAALGAIVQGVRIQRGQTELLGSGLALDATIARSGDAVVKGGVHLATEPAGVRFLWQGKPYQTSEQVLEGRTTPFAIGDVIRVHVDPNDPEHWTALNKPLPLLRHVLGGLAVLPIAAVAFLVSLALRWRMAQLWRDGEASLALVVDTHTSSLAPLSRAVRCTSAEDDADRRVFTVFVPSAHGRLEPGDTLWVLTPRGSGKRRPVRAVAWFE